MVALLSAVVKPFCSGLVHESDLSRKVIYSFLPGVFLLKSKLKRFNIKSIWAEDAKIKKSLFS